MNSEDIKSRFGSYHVSVLRQDQAHRVANLFSCHEGNAVCRTLAVTYFWRPTPKPLLTADDQIRQGQSIGSTLSDAGLSLTRHLLLDGVAISGAAYEALSSGTVSPGTSLKIQLYRLDAGTCIDDFCPYAMIAEAHHPEHVAPDLKQPQLEDWLREQKRDALAMAAGSRLLASLS